jgi:hypothetical protein
MAGKKVQPTTNHLEALDKGRKASKAIRAYLEMIRDQAAPKRRGRQIDWQARYDQAKASLEGETDVLQQLRLTRQLREAEEMLALAEAEVDVPAIEAGFVEWAYWYSEQHGIDHGTWVAMGVPPALLKKAGVTK